MNEYQQTPSVALSALENLRTRLLDLSVRNRLLSYRHGRTGNLRIVDELPDQLYELLLSEERALGSADAGTLREQLSQCDQDVIRKACPHTPANKRLLRPAMLEALLEYQPTAKGEFLERIPPYLRQATSAEEGRYLAQVLEIIDLASEEMVEMQQ